MDLPIFLDLLKFIDYQISRLPFETVKCTYSLFLRRIFSKMLNAVSLHLYSGLHNIFNPVLAMFFSVSVLYMRWLRYKANQFFDKGKQWRKNGLPTRLRFYPRIVYIYGVTRKSFQKLNSNWFGNLKRQQKLKYSPHLWSFSSLCACLANFVAFLEFGCTTFLQCNLAFPSFGYRLK